MDSTRVRSTKISDDSYSNFTKTSVITIKHALLPSIKMHYTYTQEKRSQLFSLLLTIFLFSHMALKDFPKQSYMKISLKDYESTETIYIVYNGVVLEGNHPYI